MAKKTSKKDLRNYLDFIPVHHEQYSYTVSDNGAVTVYVENKGVFNKIAQVVFKKPRISQIHLDEMGNFIWPLMDGKNTVYDIAEQVKAHFGEKAEPLYNRLVQYMRNLESYGKSNRKRQAHGIGCLSFFINVNKNQHESKISDILKNSNT